MGFLLEGEVIMKGGAPADDVDDPKTFSTTLISNTKLGQYAFYGDMFVFSTYPRRSPVKLIAHQHVHVLEFSRADLLRLLSHTSAVCSSVQQSLLRYKEWFVNANR